MALRNQPYIPLYVQDFMTDERLRECAAQSVGVFVFVMCLMHKSEQYGTILLRQKDKQTNSVYTNFAKKLVKHLPFPLLVIHDAILELTEEGVLEIDEDLLIQKRMVKDANISNARSKAGASGQKARQEKEKLANKFAIAKPSANSEYENENENEVKVTILNKGKENSKIPTKEEFHKYAAEKLGDVYQMYKLSIDFKYESWIENNWRTGGEKSREIKNWKVTLLNTLPHLKKITETPKKESAMMSVMKKNNLM